MFIMKNSTSTEGYKVKNSKISQPASSCAEATPDMSPCDLLETSSMYIIYFHACIIFQWLVNDSVVN